ncbi:hypothetical protein CLOSTMETH_02416 [[Clostridium] methylpentosum DSM 5476]|uniref:Uncharacterized protein n=1 Tax=[Clostridium] methylpentosum DSM 5476 TaxID=537013 RepID=C0EEX7_9FIRM|nr:hypothetical protein CLOSTMETH_02416 [[Clostridium] methylpentosum DSM 5476]
MGNLSFSAKRFPAVKNSQCLADTGCFYIFKKAVSLTQHEFWHYKRDLKS